MASLALKPTSSIRIKVKVLIFMEILLVKLPLVVMILVLEFVPPIAETMLATLY
ncbi:MAG: hypothetical protein R3E08_08245 [Thiotrichaceae bacterium]